MCVNTNQGFLAKHKVRQVLMVKQDLEEILVHHKDHLANQDLEHQLNMEVVPKIIQDLEVLVDKVHHRDHIIRPKLKEVTHPDNPKDLAHQHLMHVPPKTNQVANLVLLKVSDHKVVLRPNLELQDMVGNLLDPKEVTQPASLQHLEAQLKAIQYLEVYQVNLARLNPSEDLFHKPEALKVNLVWEHLVHRYTNKVIHLVNPKD